MKKTIYIFIYILVIVNVSCQSKMITSNISTETNSSLESFPAISQCLDSKDNKISITRNAVLKYGPGYYREYEKPIVEKLKITESKNDFKHVKDKVYYSVTFLYDKNKEILNLEYAAKVFIWGDTKQVFQIHFGNGVGLLELDKKKKDQETLIVPYESVQTNFVNLNDYMVKWAPNLNEAQQDSLQQVQDDLWLKYEEKETQSRIEHIRADSLMEVKIRNKYNL